MFLRENFHIKQMRKSKMELNEIIYAIKYGNKVMPGFLFFYSLFFITMSLNVKNSLPSNHPSFQSSILPIFHSFSLPSFQPTTLLNLLPPPTKNNKQQTPQQSNSLNKSNGEAKLREANCYKLRRSQTVKQSNSHPHLTPRHSHDTLPL